MHNLLNNCPIADSISIRKRQPPFLDSVISRASTSNIGSARSGRPIIAPALKSCNIIWCALISHGSHLITYICYHWYTENTLHQEPTMNIISRQPTCESRQPILTLAVLIFWCRGDPAHRHRDSIHVMLNVWWHVTGVSSHAATWTTQQRNKVTDNSVRGIASPELRDRNLGNNPTDRKQSGIVRHKWHNREATRISHPPVQWRSRQARVMILSWKTKAVSSICTHRSKDRTSPAPDQVHDWCQ